MFNYDLAHQRQADLRREAAHDRLVDGLSPQPQHNVITLVQRELIRARTFVADLSQTKPVRRRVSAWLSPQ